MKNYVVTNTTTREILYESTKHGTVKRWLKKNTYSKGLGTGYYLLGTNNRVIVDCVM